MSVSARVLAVRRCKSGSSKIRSPLCLSWFRFDAALGMTVAASRRDLVATLVASMAPAPDVQLLMNHNVSEADCIST